jgi:hypothetical protein
MSHCVAALPLQSFTIHYMQSGRSYLPNDADFGVIEKAKKTATNTCYIPQHWMELVRQARKHKPFTVVEMKGNDFVDLDVLAKQFVNRKKGTDQMPVKWLQIQSICFCKSHPQIMKFKNVCDEESAWNEVDLRRGREKFRRNRVTNLVVAERQQRKIKVNKFQDLQSLKDYIPPVYHPFYDSLAIDSDNEEPERFGDDALDISEDDGNE